MKTPGLGDAEALLRRYREALAKKMPRQGPVELGSVIVRDFVELSRKINLAQLLRLPVPSATFEEFRVNPAALLDYLLEYSMRRRRNGETEFLETDVHTLVITLFCWVQGKDAESVKLRNFLRVWLDYASADHQRKLSGEAYAAGLKNAPKAAGRNLHAQVYLKGLTVVSKAFTEEQRCFSFP